MSPGTASTTWHHSRAAERAWIMFFGTKQNWLKNCIMFMSKMKKAMILKHGLFSVRAENCRKCDIYATLFATVYRIFLTNSYKFFYKSRNTRGNGKFKVNVLKYMHKRLAKTDFYRGKRGKSSQFLAVLLHSSCEDFFVHLFWHGNPKYFIYSKACPRK